MLSFRISMDEVKNIKCILTFIREADVIIGIRVQHEAKDFN